jgi:predicted GNAT family N-acyltransferase
VAGPYRVDLLSKQHNRAAFTSGNDDLDHYFRERAGQDHRRGVATVYVLVDTATETVAGYYTLSATAIEPQGLAPGLFGNLPSYATLPATLLGRLARAMSYRGAGVGPLLLFDALARGFRISREIASLAVVVDAIDSAARRFYERHGFVGLIDDERRLILPMGSVEKLISPKCPIQSRPGKRAILGAGVRT